MRAFPFVSRNLKELVRDPMMIIFSIGFPVILLLLLSAIQSNAPISLFAISKLAPGIAVFGLSFISLFSGMLIAKDRCSSFLMRLYASPLCAPDYILGYILPLLPIAVIQSVICFVLSFFLGLSVTMNVLLALAVLIPTSVLFIGIGLLMGTLVNDKAVGGIASIVINLSGWLSGTWFSLSLVGSTFKTISDALPFARAVNATRAAIAGNYAAILPNLLWVIGYTMLVLVISIVMFRKKMQSDNA
ncbi:MAG: ABC transporter permease [Bacilli bacterium]